MIGRLTGIVASDGIDGTVVLDVGGVGYELLVPLGTLGRLTGDAQGRVTLHVHTHVREDSLVLFGFADDRERATFRLLTSVTGVGPKIAVGILGAMPVPDLAGVIARGDVKRLQTVPGVGRKLAERLALELKDKLAPGVAGATAFAPTSVATATPLGRTRPAGPERPLVDAMLRMGFKPAEVDRVVLELQPRLQEPLDALVRDALRMLTA